MKREIEQKKKNYRAPEMKIRELKRRSSLLQCSDSSDPNCLELQ